MASSSEVDRPLVTVRETLPGDMEAVLSIYTPYVLHGLARFEEVPPTLEEMVKRREAVLAAGLPYLVATVDGKVVGYSYAAAYRPHPAYRHSIENSVYVREGLHRAGVGSALLAALIARCEAGPWRQMIAVIGNSENAGSIALHGRHGFQMIGTIKDVGFKLGRWLDTVLMQLSLGPGSSQPPA